MRTTYRDFGWSTSRTGKVRNIDVITRTQVDEENETTTYTCKVIVGRNMKESIKIAVNESKGMNPIWYYLDVLRNYPQNRRTDRAYKKKITELINEYVKNRTRTSYRDFGWSTSKTGKVRNIDVWTHTEFNEKNETTTYICRVIVGRNLKDSIKIAINESKGMNPIWYYIDILRNYPQNRRSHNAYKKKITGLMKEYKNNK